jgi:hypothetical protein
LCGIFALHNASVLVLSLLQVIFPVFDGDFPDNYIKIQNLKARQGMSRNCNLPRWGKQPGVVRLIISEE